MIIDARIAIRLKELYNLLQQSDRVEAEEILGMISEAEAIWLGDSSSIKDKDETTNN